MVLRIGVAATALFALASPAGAQEVVFGVFDHGVATPFTYDTGESGIALQAAYRFRPIEGLAAIGKPAP